MQRLLRILCCFVISAVLSAGTVCGQTAAIPVPAAAASTAAVQEVLHSGLPYRDLTGLDAEAQERCRLDLVVPEGQRDFATVIWFHGGGLTKGRRAIPP
ncbi:MAG: alpha/beta hydrolase, partial [Planctomyces sp.]